MVSKLVSGLVYLAKPKVAKAKVEKVAKAKAKTQPKIDQFYAAQYT